MATQHNQPISLEDLRRDFPLGEAKEMVHQLFRRFHPPELREHIYFRIGLCKELQDELFPLSLLADHLYDSSPGAVLRYLADNSPTHDAEIAGPGKSLERIQVTLAEDIQQERIAREALVKFGHAPLWENIPYEGNQHDRKLQEPDYTTHDNKDTVREAIALITRAVERKAVKWEKQYQDVSLLVAFDDFRLFSTDDFEETHAALRSIRNPFSKTYYVGLTGRYFQMETRNMD